MAYHKSEIATHLLMGAFLVIGSTFLTGCQTHVMGWTAGPVSTNGAHRFFLIDGEGLEKDRQIVYQTLNKQLLENNYFSLSDVTQSGVYLDFHKDGVWVRNKKDVLGRTDMYLQIDIVDWRVKTEPVDPVLKQGPSYVGMVGITVTLVNRDGEIVLDEKPYVAQALAQSTAEVENVRAKAAVLAVAQFVADISPIQEKREVEWDNSDKTQKKIIKKAEAGHLKEAGAELRKRWQRDTAHVATIYNLAVVRDLLGDPQEALFLLEGLPSNYRNQHIQSYKRLLNERLSLLQQGK
jgi:hypothetical protein